MAQAKLQFLIDLEDRVSGGLDKVKGSLQGFQNRVEAMKPTFETMAAVGTAGFAAITGAVGLSIRAASDAERQWAIVGRQIELAGLSSEDTMKSIQDFAGSVQSLTGYGDEYVGMLVGRALPAVKDLNEAKRMAKIALDIEAEGTANAQAVIRGLMRAREGDIAMLGRYVPAIAEVSPELLEGMTATEKYEFAMSKLNAQFGGMAEAAAQGGGQFRILTEQIGELQELIGQQFIPILVSVVEKVKPVIVNIIAWIEKNPELTRNIIIATAAIFGLVAALGTLGLVILPAIAGLKALKKILLIKISVVGIATKVIVYLTKILMILKFIFKGVAIVIGVLLSPIGLLIAAVAALAAIGIYLYKNWETVSANLAEIWENIQINFQIVWESIQSVFNIVITGIRTGLDNLIAPIQRVIDISQRAINLAREAAGGAIRGVGETAQRVGQFGAGIRERIFGRALGGAVFAGSPYLVGERGAELFVPNRAGTIIPNNRLGGGTTIVITGNTLLDRDAARKIGDEMVRYLRDNFRI